VRAGIFIFPRVTTLDFVGAYDALRRVEGVTCTLLGTDTRITDEGGLSFEAIAWPELSAFDLLLVPGGHGTRPLEQDARCIDYLRSWGTSKPLASVCTGAMLIGLAGHLKGLKATTHFGSYDRLAPHCAEVVRDVRTVDAGRVVTGGAVSSSLDVGLLLVEKHFGAAERSRVARAMNFGA
jgi:transcriptional regulator GlxA family with amidase domain